MKEASSLDLNLLAESLGLDPSNWENFGLKIEDKELVAVEVIEPARIRRFTAPIDAVDRSIVPRLSGGAVFVATRHDPLGLRNSPDC